MKQANAGLILTLLVVLLSVASRLSLAPPEMVPAAAPADQFSAERALRHLQEIASQPHPIGSTEHARVRSYLLEQMRLLGGETQVQTANVVRQESTPWVIAATVHNAIGRWPGREKGKAVLLMAHYDTVSNSPGAADDGAGVAALLEALRALRQGTQLRNDLILLITDGEEVGLLGAKAFVTQHPWAQEVGLVLNFEARGTEGPSLMFETSRDGGRLIAALDRAMPRATATSLSGEIYRRMPNDTDFSAWRETGVSGLNFAFIEGESTYHTNQDNLQRLDPRSLQHHGEYALALARHFGDADLDGDLRPSSEPVYFNLLSTLVTYPRGAVIPLMLATSIAMLVLLIVGFRRRRLSAGGLLMATAYNLLGAAVVAGVMWFLGKWLIGWGYVFSLWNGWSSLSLNLLGLGLVTVAVTLASYRWRARRQQAEDLVAGGLLVVWMLTIASSLVSPGASYLFALPLVLGQAAAWRWLIGEPRFVRDGDALLPWPALFAMAAAGALVALVWPSTLALFGTALGFIGAPVNGLVVFILLHGFLAPHLELDRLSGRPWILPAAILVLGLGTIAATHLASGHDADNRRYYNLFHVYDTESEEAFWGTIERQPHPWVRQFIPAEEERVEAPPYLFFGQWLIFRAPAGTPELDEAEIRVEATEEIPTGRRIEIAIHWPYDVHMATVLLRSEGELRLSEVAGEAIEPSPSFGPGDAPSRRALRYWGPPAEGLRLTVEVADGAPLEVETIARRWTLPELEGFSYPERPADVMPMPGWESDTSFVRDRVVLSAVAQHDPSDAPPAPASPTE